MINNFSRLMLALMVFFVLVFPVYSQIVVDHTAVQQFDQIPESWLEKAKELTVHYGHRSHGSQVLTGLRWLQINLDPVMYNVGIGRRNDTRTPNLPDTTNPVSLRIWEEGLYPETEGSHFGYWRGDLAQSGTMNILSSGLFNVSGWSWCGEVSLEEWDFIQEYIDVMAYYESLYPDVTFFYMTGHCVPPGPPRYRQLAYERWMNNNNGIRQYCIDNQKVLFDFADIERHDLDGNLHEFEDASCIWCETWCQEHPEDCINLPPRSESGCTIECASCAHSHGLNCVIKGKAFWWMLARIAGWDPDVSLPVEMIHFDASIKDNNVLLQWQTASEIDNYGFEIERAILNEDCSCQTEYHKIAFVPGNLSSSRLRQYSYTDRNLLEVNRIVYRLRQIDTNGSYKISDALTVELHVEEIQLFQNYPNPFNNSTKIKFAIPKEGRVKITIFNMVGQKITTLLDGHKMPGFHEVEFNAQALASGTYFYRIKAGDMVKSKEMLLVK